MNNILVRILQYILPRRLWYRKLYLRSRHWREIRHIKVMNVRNRCEKCRRRPYYGSAGWRPLDVHHLTYVRIWHERLSDLEVLCRICHRKAHAH